VFDEIVVVLVGANPKPIEFAMLLISESAVT